MTGLFLSKNINLIFEFYLLKKKFNFVVTAKTYPRIKDTKQKTRQLNRADKLR